MTKTRKIWYGVLFALSAALLVVGSFFDKSIAEAMYQPENVPARIMEAVGIFPPFVFVSGLFAVLFYLVKDEDKRRILKKVLTAAAVALSYMVFGFMAAKYLFDTAWVWALIAVAASMMLSPLTFLLFRNTRRDTLKRLSIFLIFASMVSLISTVISVNVLKYLWGRPRFYELIEAKDDFLSSFTPWYHPNGFSLKGHHSFPSGHTSAATNLLVLCALPEVFPDAQDKNKTVAFVSAVYIFSMAYSRMVLGAHFLTDVTAGFVIGFVTYAVARYLYFDKSRIVVDAILKVNSVPEEKSDFLTDPPEEGRVEVDCDLSEETNEEIVHSATPVPSEAESEEVLPTEDHTDGVEQE